MCLQFVQKQCLQTKHCCWHCCFIGYWLFVCTEIILKINSRQNSACLSSADKTMTCIFAILNPTQQNFSWNTAELVVNTTNQNLPLTSPAEFVFNQHSRICRPCWQYRSIGSMSSREEQLFYVKLFFVVLGNEIVLHAGLFWSSHFEEPWWACWHGCSSVWSYQSIYFQNAWTSAILHLQIKLILHLLHKCLFVS